MRRLGLRARLRRLFDGIARLFRRAVAAEPARVRPIGRAAALSLGARPSERSVVRSDEAAGLDDFEGDVLPFGDFADQDEAQRFSALPPIGAEALDGVDWDVLARELTGPR